MGCGGVGVWVSMALIIEIGCNINFFVCFTLCLIIVYGTHYKIDFILSDKIYQHILLLAFIRIPNIT